MQRIAIPLAIAALLCACGGKRSDTEHLLITWADALNHHLATSSESNYTYPHALSEIDPLLRVALPFEDPWGRPLHYRRIDDGHYDLVSLGPDGELGGEDDVIVHNGLLQKPAKVYAQRPASAGLAPQGEGAAPGIAD
jgi:hypothetical protein